MKTNMLQDGRMPNVVISVILNEF